MASGIPDGDTEFGGPTRSNDVSGAVTATLVRLVRSLTGDGGVLQMLALAGEFRSGETLERLETFSSHRQMVTLFHAAAQVTGDGAIGLHTGEELVRQYLGTEVERRFVALGSTSAMVVNLTESVPHLTTSVASQAVDVGDTYAKVKVITPTTVGRHLHFCEFTRGFLSQAPVAFGSDPATVIETECQARGGRFCLYVLSWTEPAVGPPPEPEDLFPSVGTFAEENRATLDLDPEIRAAQLAGQLHQMEERLEGVFSTASELLGEEGIDTLLQRITSRAARAVSASKYLLVVRTSPDADIQLHHSGFNPDEAQAMADELVLDQPDDDDGARLIVDIRSARRRYGRLAAVYPPGVRYFESERRMLDLYAGYAATALDMVTSLEDARRSDATARALLGFSGALSRVTTTDATAQLLADTVPTVTGCQHSAVLLWDPEERQLTVRGETEGFASQALGFDHIVVTGGDSALSDRTPRGDELPLSRSPLTVSTATPAVERMIASRTLAVIDSSTEDPLLRDLLLRGGTTASVIAPLFAGDEFLGVVSANFTGDVPGIVVRNRDLHERLSGLADQAVTAFQNVRLLEQISHSAWHDSLTGLPNRRLLEDRVGQELTRGQRVGESSCLFFIDLDRFKSVNDSFGHAAGDELIRQVGERLNSTVRHQDTVARLGGDEFAVLLPGLADPVAIDQLARRCLELLNTPYQIYQHEVHSSASIGIALAPEDGHTYEELMVLADQAMYRSKAVGRNTFTRYAGEQAAVPE
jgi:diguanylate cyclase (GGDEF)-like protein